jgi:hypothetical protein
MTPKEKALQLCDAFYQYLPLERYVITTDRDLSWEYDGWENAKQCALIAVDEILKEYAHAENHIEDIMGRISLYIKYWKEVKQEIEKL